MSCCYTYTADCCNVTSSGSSLSVCMLCLQCFDTVGWHSYLSGARCRLAYGQLIPLLLTVSCSSKIQIGFTFLVPAHPGSPGQRAVKRVCVCVCLSVCLSVCSVGVSCCRTRLTAPLCSVVLTLCCLNVNSASQHHSSSTTLNSP